MDTSTVAQPTLTQREAIARREVARQGLRLQKSRARSWSVDDHQGYRIVNRDNVIEAGEKFDLLIEDVERWALPRSQ